MQEKGIYVDPNTFVPLSRLKENLTAEMATRQFAMGGYTGFFGHLPDPDPILRKLGCDQTVYEDLLSDSRVGSMVTRRKNLTKSMDWDIDRSEGAGDKEADLCKLIINTWEDNDIPIKDLISQTLNPIFYGYSVFEIMWRQVKNYWLPVKVQEKPREWFFFDTENQLRFRSIDNWEGTVIRGKDADPKVAAKFIILVNDPTYKNPYGDKSLSRCYWPVTFKRGGMKLFADFIERFGMPFIYGKLPRGASQEMHDNLFNQLVNFISGAVGTGPDDSSVQLIEPKGGSGSSDLYDRYLDRCDNAISEALLTNSLSTSVQKNGARASSETGAETIEGGLGQEDKDFPTAFFNKIFKRAIDLNIGSGNYTKFKFFEEEDINKDKSERDKNLKEIGVKFKKKYFVSQYNFEEDEIEVAEETPAGGSNLPAGDPLANKLPGQTTLPVTLPDKTELSFFKSIWNKFFNKHDFASDKTAITDQVIDSLPEKLLQFGIEQTLKPVIELAKNSAGYEELKIELAKQFPKMDTTQLENLLTKVLFIVEIEGGLDAKKDA